MITPPACDIYRVFVKVSPLKCFVGCIPANGLNLSYDYKYILNTFEA